MRLLKRRDSKFDDPINRVLLKMQTVNDVGSEEYEVLMERLSKLNELKTEERKRGVSPDTMFLGGVNLLGILIIVGYEHGHVIVSKAFGHVKGTKL